MEHKIAIIRLERFIDQRMTKGCSICKHVATLMKAAAALEKHHQAVDARCSCLDL